MCVYFPDGTQPGGNGRVLRAAVRRAADYGASRAGRAAAEGAGRPGAAAADVAGRLPRGRRGMRVRPERRVRPVPADDQPPPEGAARGWPGGPGQARRMGLLPGPPAGPGQPGRADRLRAAITPALPRASAPDIHRLSSINDE